MNKKAVTEVTAFAHSAGLMKNDYHWTAPGFGGVAPVAGRPRCLKGTEIVVSYFWLKHLTLDLVSNDAYQVELSSLSITEGELTETIEWFDELLSFRRVVNKVLRTDAAGNMSMDLRFLYTAKQLGAG